MSKKVLKVLVPFMLILWMIVGNALTLKAVGAMAVRDVNFFLPPIPGFGSPEYLSRKADW